MATTRANRLTSATTGPVRLVGSVIGLALAGCTTAATPYPYDDTYVYTAYYPTDMLYSSYYYASPWDYDTLYYYALVALPPVAAVADASPVPTTSGRTPTGLASALETLATGGDVCAGQVTVTPRTAAPLCPGAQSAQERTGVTIAFSGCHVVDDTIDGTVDVVSTRSASDSACGAGATVNLQTTVNLSSLKVTRTDGSGITLPTQASTISASFPVGQSPQTFNATSSGELQVFGAGGVLLGDLGFQGQDTFSLPGAQSFTVDGTTTFHEMLGTATATVTKSSLTRSGGCCRPTGGSIVINRTGGNQPGQVTWDFGPACGTVMRNGTPATMSACIE